MRVLKTAPGEVLDVAFSPDCRAIAAAVEGAGIFLWNLDSPNIAPVRLEVEVRPAGLRFSPDGRRLSWQAIAGRRTYDRDNRTATNETYPMLATPNTLAHATYATRAITQHGIPDYNLLGWQLKEDEWIRQWQISTRALRVANVTLAPTGDRFAMFTCVDIPGAEHRWRLEIRDTATSAEIAVGSYPYSYAAKPLRFNPQGDLIAGISGMTLLAWSLPTGGAPRLVQNDNRKHYTALAYHPNGHQLFLTSNDATVHVFDTHTLDRVNRYTWQLDELSAVAISADGTLAAAGSATGDVVVWDLD
jgi:WD40 repeat protein